MSGSVSTSDTNFEAKAPGTGESRDASGTEHHCVYCPTCSTRLYARRCKLICAECGYYLSCADYY